MSFQVPSCMSGRMKRNHSLILICNMRATSENSEHKSQEMKMVKLVPQ